MKRRWMDWAVLAVGTGLFLGMVPPRTATLAAMLGIPLAMGLHALVGWTWYLPVLALLCVVGVPICQRSAELLGCADPREVTYDEFVTVPIVYFMVPAFTFKVIVVGFLLHRFFDILKPLGVANLERLGGGLGIMCDDILSGIYGLAIMRLLIASGYLV